MGPDGLAFQYAVIDGKQRLEAIYAFLSGDLSLAEDFKFFENETVRAGGMRFAEMSSVYPDLAQTFLDYELPVISVATDSGDLIEEMFQRLNASSSLNAAERRNSVSGSTRVAANELAEHPVLVDGSPIKNARYKYRELGAKFLAIEHQLDEKGRILDTKADTLYKLFTATHGAKPSISEKIMFGYRERASSVLDEMRRVFDDGDALLSSIGTVVVYYIVFRQFKTVPGDLRSSLMRFEDFRRAASRMSEQDSGYARPENARLREYNVLVQSTNDGAALSRRAEILSAFLVPVAGGDGLSGLSRLQDGAEVPEGDAENE
jgi:hypothetical protein